MSQFHLNLCSQYSTHVPAHRIQSVQYTCTGTPHSQYSTHVPAHRIPSVQTAISNKTSVQLPLCMPRRHFRYRINSKAVNVQMSVQRLPHGWYATAKNKIWTYLTFIRPCITKIFPNYNQQDATFLDLFISTHALHVSGGSSTHHQEHITLHTASGIGNQLVMYNQLYSYVLLMMGGGTEWNM